MRILHVAEHCCVRVAKMTAAARATGEHWIGVCTQREVVGATWDDTYYYNGPESIERAIEHTKPDVVHVHNEPNWPVQVAALHGAAPVVWDVHDLDFVRYGKPRGPESNIAREVDGIIVPSKAYQQALGAGEVLYSLPAAEYKRWDDRPVDALFIEGHITTDKPHAPWLDYRAIAQRFLAVGRPVIMQPGGEDPNIQNGYDWFALKPVPYDTMMKRVPRFRWGLVAGGMPHAQWDAAMPNKLFEYVICGVVPVVMWAKEAAEWVREHKIGVVLEQPEDAPKVMTQVAWNACRKRIKDFQDKCTAETQGPRLMELYQKAQEHFAKRKESGNVGITQSVA